jgi:hypothetical protein
MMLWLSLENEMQEFIKESEYLLVPTQALAFSGSFISELKADTSRNN